LEGIVCNPTLVNRDCDCCDNLVCTTIGSIDGQSRCQSPEP
jgi:hypothetical protein